MHCHLAVRAATKVPEARSASRALSLPRFKDGGTTKSTQMTANDRLVHFMAQLPFYVETTTSLEVGLKCSLSPSCTALIGLVESLPNRAASLVRFYPQDQRGASGQIRGQAIRNHF